MKGRLRSFERRLDRLSAQMKADEEAKAAAGTRGEEVGGLEAVLNRSEPCAVCLAIMQDNSLKPKASIEAFDFREPEVDINERRRK